jgi:hypothetical protein
MIPISSTSYLWVDSIYACEDLKALGGGVDDVDCCRKVTDFGTNMGALTACAESVVAGESERVLCNRVFRISVGSIYKRRTEKY